MSVSDAFVRVYCDKCDCETEITLTATAGKGCWDERNVDREITSDGWRRNIGGYELLCLDCAGEIEETA